MNIPHKGHPLFGEMEGLFDCDIAARAVALVMPAILAMMQDGTAKRSDLHICVGLHGTLMYEHSVGVAHKWESPYDLYARSKFYLATREGGHGSSAYVQALAPHLLKRGDTLYFGSVNLDGIVVSASGIQAYFDEMIAMMIAAAVRALCKEKAEKARASGMDLFRNFGIPS